MNQVGKREKVCGQHKELCKSGVPGRLGDVWRLESDEPEEIGRDGWQKFLNVM